MPTRSRSARGWTLEGEEWQLALRLPSGMNAGGDECQLVVGLLSQMDFEVNVATRINLAQRNKRRRRRIPTRSERAQQFGRWMRVWQFALHLPSGMDAGGDECQSPLNLRGGMNDGRDEGTCMQQVSWPLLLADASRLSLMRINVVPPMRVWRASRLHPLKTAYVEVVRAKLPNELEQNLMRQ